MKFESMQSKQPQSPEKKPIPKELERVTSQEIDDLFKNLEMKPEDFVKAYSTEMRNLASKFGLTEAEQKRFGELLNLSWVQMGIVKSEKRVDEKTINEMQNYLVSTQQWFENTYGTKK